ncbi:MAG: CPBP family intramembrane glutamic endopeptidase [Candidatus Dormibacteria bacterium]
MSLVLIAAGLRQAVASTSVGTVGATYAFAALLLIAWGAWRFRSASTPAEIGLRPGAILAGVAVAALLLAPGAWLHANGHPTRTDLYGPGFFVPFIPALLWVAPAEELFLRGLLQPLLRDRLGSAWAIVGIGVLFAAIHLPAYGWSAMPLDFGVGVLLGWLREETRSVAACVTAHTLADLGSWFLA